MVSNYSIILKQDNLSSEEYKQLYKYLIKDDLVNIKFDLNHIDKVISRLKYPSKVVKGTFRRCPRQFQFARIFDLWIQKKDETTIWDVYGKNTHMIFNKIWDNISYKKIIESKTEKLLSYYIYQKCMNFIPEADKKIKLYPSIFKQYSDYEAFRIYSIFKELGRVKVKKYIIPLYRELRIENHDRYEVGVVDVMHTLTTDEIAIGDYKTGKAKYYEWKWNPRISQWAADELEKSDTINWDKITIDFELGSYYNLTLGTKKIYKVLDDENNKPYLKELEYLQITKGFVVYINDWKNTFKYIPLQLNMLNNVNGIKSDMIECYNSGIFPLKVRNDCFDFCPYIDICIKDKAWQNWFNKIDPFYKNKLDKLLSILEVN